MCFVLHYEVKRNPCCPLPTTLLSGSPHNQGNSHREARLSGRMPQIAPRRFAVEANTVRSTKGAQRTCADRSIIQDSKLIGSVMHFLIADPTEGHGIFYSLRASPPCGGTSCFAPFSERSRRQYSLWRRHRNPAVSSSSAVAPEKFMLFPSGSFASLEDDTMEKAYEKWRRREGSRAA